jgi:hypothetical protein
MALTLMYLGMVYSVRNLTSQPLFDAKSYLFLMLSWVNRGAFWKPCCQYTHRIFGNVILSNDSTESARKNK